MRWTATRPQIAVVASVTVIAALLGVDPARRRSTYG